MASDQAGKVIVVRDDRGGLNTHFWAFAKPMGIDPDALERCRVRR